ncbi:MAG: aminotransferase class I/II-fold pyridoxal phosphate-dependent enzyme, partial [Ilumatobacteraceae bacterium]
MAIPYGRQSISSDDIHAVSEVLKSDFLTQGPVVPKFEAALSEWCGAKFAIAANSATSALHLACMAIGLEEGDRVWTSPITFVASANCARYCGSDVDFVDIDPRTYNLSATRLAEKLSVAKKNGTLPKVVIPVHLSGQSCDMEAIHMLSKEYGFSIIEDASHAVGGSYKGKPIGGCQ